MDNNMNNNQSHYSCKQRIISLLTLFFFLFQTTGTAVAAVVTAVDIQTELSTTLEFEPAPSGSPVQYVGVSDFLEASAQGMQTIQDFYKRLQNESLATLGAPIYVPIAVGDITTIIPTYSNPPVVGSAFVQSRYVRNQIHGLLGRHLIDSELMDYRSEAAQLYSLYNNAVAYAKTSGRIYGTRLGIDQEQSPVNMIWPERHVINGKEVVVPVVYLTPQTIADRKVQDHEVNFNGAVNFGAITVNGVNIKLARDAFLRANNDLTVNDGSIASAGDMTIVAGGTLSLMSSLIDAGGNLTIGAHNVQSQTLVHRYDLGYEHGSRFGEISQVRAGGDVTIRSYSDIVLQGTDVTANNITMAADGNIYIGAIADTYGEDLSGRWRGEWSAVDYLQSHLTAEESIELMAGGQIVIDAAELVADKGHIELLAQMGITIEDELGQYQRNDRAKFGKKKVTESVYQTVAIRSVLDAGRGVKLHTDFGDITLKAVDITSGSGTQVKAANGAVNLLLTTETDHYAYSSVKEGMFTTKTVNKGHTIETGVPNTIVGGFAVEALNGVNVEYQGMTGLDCRDYLAEIGQSAQAGEDPCLRANVLKISEMPGMAWMGEVLALADADPDSYHWDEIALQHKTWSESNTSLSPALMAVISIAVAIVAGPAGAAVASSVGATGAIGAAISAGTVALISQASVAFANGAVNGHIGTAMRDFASEDTLKSLAISMVTAGAIAALDAAVFGLDADAVNKMELADATEQAIDQAMQEAIETSTQSLLAQSGQAVIHATVRAGVSTIISRGDDEEFWQSFGTALASDAISRLGESLANEIGEAKFNGQIDTSIQYIAHAGVGCLAGSATATLSDGETSLGCYSGAGGAVVGEAIGQLYRDDLQEDLEGWVRERLANGQDVSYDLLQAEAMVFKQHGVDMAKLGAALTAFVAGGDVDIAAAAGENAAENNALLLLAVVVVAAYTSYVSYQEGGLYEGLQAIGRGDDPLSQAMSDLTGEAIELAFDQYPEEAARVAGVINAAGDLIADGMKVVYETETGQRVVEYVNTLDKNQLNALIGAGKVVSFIIPAQVVSKIATLKKVSADSGSDKPIEEWVNDPAHSNWNNVSPADKSVLGQRYLPEGYNSNGNNIVGPQGGVYQSTGKIDLNGDKVYSNSGKYYTFENGVKTQIPNPDTSPGIHINTYRNHHDQYVSDVQQQLIQQGYSVETDVRFYDSCGTEYCKPDLVYRSPESGKVSGILEIKSGDGRNTQSQLNIYPQIESGDAIPSGDLAERLGLESGVSLRNQGYPNGIPVYQITVPGYSGVNN